MATGGELRSHHQNHWNRQAITMQSGHGVHTCPPEPKEAGCEIDRGFAESDMVDPVPANTPIEGWPATFQRNPDTRRLTLDDVHGGRPDLNADRHGIVVVSVNRKLYEFYRLTRTDAGWTAEQASIFD